MYYAAVTALICTSTDGGCVLVHASLNYNELLYACQCDESGDADECCDGGQLPDFDFLSDWPKDGSATDAVVAYSMPVLQLAEAISSMRDIKDIGEKVKEETKKDLIFKILSIVFMVIPFVGEALGPLIGSAAVARIALLIGEAGNGALTVARHH
ncbi:hypothetical protein IFM58399_07743 [Aspergillus lentulus]|uniref:Uncharacterized protein n=1 Tax=Aspergillus lentulus TaxID=293939 RepID=A0AAN5YT66_ASPLE|nr:uncharacterized protein IFM58399_07743 [Aspergillus lentulus]KAF4160231.1 hypothetical protein CNMCM6069_009302 [Aspergillus lentulus]KAF4170042.1 hypothetical protein CNMCM6936_005187 [Aspergillus lentulus]KAF4181836.1 hypothetical protein CNMCM8060_008207 [Aspergillus lentulus]KAF4189786.1 hypothetical protein CNMCM7927_006570 [Aspergillus lentulus]KAF4198120.1 hypothetical protein CNMCM8694_000804 [Aspergillus lentulus]